MKPHCPSVQPPVSVARLHELLTCDFATGLLTWKVQRGGFAQAGTPAGKPRADGYIGLKVEGRQYLAHRVIWAMRHGHWPVGQIDHRNLRRADNWIDNLREATNALNQVNRAYRRTSGLPRGVARQHSGRFQAQIQIAGRKTGLGTFDTAEEAAAVYRAAARKAFGDFAFEGGSRDR